VTLQFCKQVQLGILVNAFVTVSTVWSVYCLLFSTHGAPRAQSFVKVGEGRARAPRAPWSRRHCIWLLGRRHTRHRLVNCTLSGYREHSPSCVHEHEFIQPQQQQCRWLCAAQ